MKIRVENIQQYAIGRGGHIFPPRQTVEVPVKNDQQYREIKACVYLRSKVIEVVPPDDGSTELVVELTAEEALNALNKPALQEIAANAGLDLPAKTTKPELVAAILAAADAEDDGDGDEPTPVQLAVLDEMTDDELRELLAAHEVEADADATHEQLIGTIAASEAFAVEVADEPEE